MGETTSASTPLASIASSRASAEKKASEALNCMRSVSSSRTRSSSQGPTRGPRWSSLCPTASSAPGITCACMSSNTLRLLALGLNLKRCRLGAHAHVHPVAVAQVPDRGLGVGQLELAAVHPLQREAAGLDDPDRLEIGLGADAEGARHRDALVDQAIRDERDLAAALQPREHDAAAVPHALDRVADGLLGHRGELEHHVGHGPAGELGHPLDDVLLLDVDRVVGAELE